MRGAIAVLSFLLLLRPLTPGQSVPPQKPTASAATLGLKVTFGDRQPGCCIAVPVGSRHIWVDDYPRDASWKGPEDASPIIAVKVSFGMVGRRVKVVVSLVRGRKFHEAEEVVAKRLAEPFESFVVGELAKFGVRPFAFKVLPREEVRPPELGLFSKTRSVEVLSAESSAGFITVRLRNNSKRGVTSLSVRTMREGRVLVYMDPGGSDGRAFIGPGATRVLTLPADGEGTETAGGYVPLLADGVGVVSALFSDGSYEGELLPAATAAGQYGGQRLHLARLLDLIERALGSENPDAPGAAAEFEKMLDALGRDAPSATVDSVFDAYPGLEENARASIRSAVEGAMGLMRQAVYADLRAVGRPADGKSGAPLTFRGWPESRRRNYGEWLARLE